MTMSYRVGVDIGGTFTDVVLLGSDGTIHTKKISSSVDNYARAIVDGLVEALRHGMDKAAAAGGALPPAGRRRAHRCFRQGWTCARCRGRRARGRRPSR